MPANSPTGGRRRIVLYSPRYAPKGGAAPRAVHLPLSLLTLAGLPLREGFDVVLIDGNLHEPKAAHRLVDEACRGALLYGTTGVVGHQVADAHRCSQRVRASHPRLRTIVGGWFASSNARLQLLTGLFDAVALGQGELTFLDVVRAVDAGEPLDAVPGLALLRDGDVVRTPRRDVVGWDRLVNCPWRLLDFDAYRERQLRAGPVRADEHLPRPPWIPRSKPHVGIVYHASYGCPERCAFCCSPAVTELRWKAMTAERVLDDLTELHERWGFDDVGFYDASWGASERRARAFAEGMLDRDLRFGYRASLRASTILRYRAETLDLLAESGLHAAEVGAEAGSAEMLERIGKTFKLGDELAAARALNDRGVAAWMDFLIGYPNESEASMLATIDRARAVRSACDRARIAVRPFVPLPGTALWDEAVAAGLAAPRTLGQWSNVDAFAPRASRSARLPARILRRCERLHRDGALSTGEVRGKIGWWERRAQRRLRNSERRFASLEARALSAYLCGRGLWRRWMPGAPATPPLDVEAAAPWERRSSQRLREHVLVPRAPTAAVEPAPTRPRIGATSP